MSKINKFHDRYSISLALVVVGLIVVFALGEKFRGIGFLVTTIGGILGAMAAFSGARVRYVEDGFDTEGIHVKLESECGSKVLKDLTNAGLDGLGGKSTKLKQPAGKYAFKMANGTDWWIDKSGEIHPCGIGSDILNAASGGGWLGEAPDGCWE